MKILNLPIELPQDACCKARPDQSADLTAYLLDPMAETASRLRPAVVICPGGGYTRLSEREDQPVAMEYLAAGFQVFSLHYSVAPDVFPRALMELALAVRLIRLNSAKWHVDPEKIVVSGFSAGGHLACCLGVFYNRDFLCGPLKTSPEQIRPDGLLLCYPVICWGRTPRTRRNAAWSPWNFRPARTRRPPFCGTPARTRRCQWKTACSSPTPCAATASAWRCTSTPGAATVCPLPPTRWREETGAITSPAARDGSAWPSPGSEI